MVTLVVSNWYCSHTNPVWEDYQNLPYRNEPFNDPESVTAWRKLGYTQTQFTGNMYDMRQPEPSWMHAIKQQFSWKNFSWSLYCMKPGTVLPNHSDTYNRFRKIHDIVDPDCIWRAIIFLESWASGHYFEIDQHPVVNWRVGDTVIWKNAVPHIAANLGRTDRYTLQITGVQ